MAAPSEKLAQSLELLRALQDKNGNAIIKADALSRTHKDRLLANGFIQEVIKGWFIASRPESPKGDTTSWYTSFWDFANVYLTSRFEDKWCLSPDQSLQLHGDNKTVPKQLLVRSPKARNKVTRLIFNTSILDVRTPLPVKNEILSMDGLNVYSLESGLITCGTEFFTRHPTDARTCLAMIKDGSGLLAKLLDGGHSVIAGRLAGAFRNIGKDKIADEIIETMKSAGYDVRETDPFADKIQILLRSRESSPYVYRIKIMWSQMRQTVIENFPKASGLLDNVSDYLKQVEDNYSKDAYHSLSIEGYRVTPELIERVRSGNWNPDENIEDSEQKNAMAARGYYLAFQEVKKSIKSILNGENSGTVADKDHGTWYRELFAPSVTSGILKASDLAGYRNGPVYIKGSMHTPPNHEAVWDSMPVLFDLLKEETEASVRIVLGHFVFVYIHPYFDGNGRIARFLMNANMASGGYPWTIIPIEMRDDYMSALEKASISNDITDFAKFISRRVEEKN
ncbi:MAG: Fic family protein, partial [Candidatus Heimdallarchaeota archaeon]|nr:Fic family protein [Candidatus Heimdallarchaeota archaeon]